jgi:hypothetical protein
LPGFPEPTAAASDRRSEVENTFSNLHGPEVIRLRRRFYAQSRSRKSKDE